MKFTGRSGVDLIKHFEGLSLKSYRCPAGVWTIGYGSTGRDIGPGMTWSARQCEDRLIYDLKRFEQAVNRLAPRTTQNQFDALVSFAFNLGEGALSRSTLLRKHNSGDYAGAKAEFVRWNKAGGKVLAGLTRRRAAEAALYGKE